MLIAILIINILSLSLILSGMRELGMRLTSLEVTLEELLEESEDPYSNNMIEDTFE